MARVLTTGAASGLGKFLHERFRGFGFTRASWAEDFPRLKASGVDVIIHCAASGTQEDVALMEEVASIPHKKFVFISSVDVYPKDGARHDEGERLAENSASTDYGMSKLACEALVASRCPNHLILRPSSLLGPYIRSGSVRRLLREPDCRLSLSADSRLNCVLHSDVAAFLETALREDLRGIYNAVSASSATLAELAEALGRKPSFGSHRYDAGNVDNSKIAAVEPRFRRGTLDVLREFAGGR